MVVGPNTGGGGGFAMEEFCRENCAVKKGGEIFPWRNLGGTVPFSSPRLQGLCLLRASGISRAAKFSPGEITPLRNPPPPPPHAHCTMYTLWHVPHDSPHTKWCADWCADWPILRGISLPPSGGVAVAVGLQWGVLSDSVPQNTAHATVHTSPYKGGGGEGARRNQQQKDDGKRV